MEDADDYGDSGVLRRAGRRKCTIRTDRIAAYELRLAACGVDAATSGRERRASAAGGAVRRRAELRGHRRIQAAGAMARARSCDGGCRRGGPGARRRAEATDAHGQCTRVHDDANGRGACGLLAHRARRHEARGGGETAGAQTKLGSRTPGYRNAPFADCRRARRFGQGYSDAGARAELVERRRPGRTAREHWQARP